MPTYLQLVHQVEHALRLGYLKPDDQLPKVERCGCVAGHQPEHGAKAYRELETKGLIVGRPGQGTFILATLRPVALPDLTGLRRSLRGWLAKADTQGLTRAGSWRSSPVSCGISMSAAAARAAAATSGETEGVA